MLKKFTNASNTKLPVLPAQVFPSIAKIHCCDESKDSCDPGVGVLEGVGVTDKVGVEVGLGEEAIANFNKN